jgi:mannitol/fructose-specific phosphotransferase system IIA component (Ntr-type)
VAMSLLRLREGVEFANGSPVNIVVIIATTDKNSHIKALLQLTNILTCEEAVDELVESENKQDILRVIHRYVDVLDSNQ